MTLQEYVQKHGTSCMYAIAILCGSKETYFNNLLYTCNMKHEPFKRPSKKMAAKIVYYSKGEITYEGLQNPVPMPAFDYETYKRPRMRRGVKKLLGIKTQKKGTENGGV
jgi:hypothetical protein